MLKLHHAANTGAERDDVMGDLSGADFQRRSNTIHP